MMMVAMMVPVQVTIVALYKIMNLLGVINTSLAVTLPSILGGKLPGTCRCLWCIYDEAVFSVGSKRTE